MAPLIVDALKRDLMATVEWGKQKMQEGSYELALQHFNKALELKPGFMQALVSRGFCYLSLGDEAKAQNDFVEVINKDAGFNRNIYILMALCCKRSGNYSTAIRYLNRCLSHFNFPSFTAALIARGELSLKVGDFERARSDFWQVVEQTPTHLVARRGLADALRGLSNFKEALRHYSKAVADVLQAMEHLEVKQGEHHRDEARTPDDIDGQELQDDEDDFYLAGGYSNLRLQECAEVQSERSSDLPKDLVQEDASDQVLHGNIGSEERMLTDPEQLRSFLAELLMRRALCLRLVGQLEAAGSDLLEVFELIPKDGLALFWYAKLLIEQQRHQEAVPFLRASLEHYESTRAHANALIGALLMTSPDPDFQNGYRHLQEAEKLAPKSQPIRVTSWICSAAVALHQTNPPDSLTALSLLDKALSFLEVPSFDIVPPSGGRSSGSRSARGSRSAKHVAGSGGAAALALSARGCQSAEEARWHAARTLVRRQQELAQGDDLEQALECRSYLQLVAKEASQRASEVPSMLFVLRLTALCNLCRWEEAIIDCRRILSLNPDDEVTQYKMHLTCGIVRSQAAKFEAAVGCFTKAIRLQPAGAEARLHRAIALAQAARANGSTAAHLQDTARIAQLLTDAVQDLEAVDQQALISGEIAPLGAAHLRASCLCSLGRPGEAFEVLCDSGQRCAGRRTTSDGINLDPAVARQRSLEAEVLLLLCRHNEAIEACSAVLALNSSGHTEARLMRAWCLSEIGDLQSAFEDMAAAVDMSPTRSDVHEACGDLKMTHGLLDEAIAAYSAALCLSDLQEARIAYKRALAQLSLGQLTPAHQDFHCALRVSPQMQSALRARDGVNALQTLLTDDWRHAHVRFNMLLHQGSATVPVAHLASGNGPDSLPVLFLPHELLVYRAVCSLYLSDISTAIQDFATALELARQLHSSAGQVDSTKRASLPLEASSQQGLACFQCECLYNIALCHLRGRDYPSALMSVERLISQHQEDLLMFGSNGLALVWFLAGVCHLALEGDEFPRDQLAREAFSRSYAFNASFVDDFLRRHNPKEMSESELPRPQQKPLRPIGGCPVPVRPVLKEREVCNAKPDAVCCLHFKNPFGIPGEVGSNHAKSASIEDHAATTSYQPSQDVFTADDVFAGDEDAAGQQEGMELDVRANNVEHSSIMGSQKDLPSLTSRRLLSDLLPPIRLQVRDVVIWARPSVSWPFVRAPDWKPPTTLARLDLLQDRTAGQITGGRGGP